MVAAMLADLGLAAIAADPDHTWLLYEPCYELEIILVTPRDHPLARKRRVRVNDLADFPLVNSPSSFGVTGPEQDPAEARAFPGPTATRGGPVHRPPSGVSSPWAMGSAWSPRRVGICPTPSSTKSRWLPTWDA